MSHHISRRGVLRGAGLAATAAAVSTALPRSASAATPAQTGADFLASLGVGAHMGQGVDAAPGVATALSYLGIGNLRDDANSAHVDDWISVHQQSGARINLIANHDIADTVGIAKKLAAAGALMSVEGPNEPNNSPITYEGQTSSFSTTFLPVAHFVRDLYQAIKAEPTLRNLPVFASSEAGGSEPDNVGLQFLTIPAGAGALLPDGTTYAEFANTHTYPQGHTNNWVDNMAWNGADPTLNGDWDGLYVEFGHTWHGGFPGYSTAELRSLPRVMTESGWPTQGDGSITEDRQGRLIMSIYLSNFARGWHNTFIYMLRDDPVQGFWGLIDQNYQPKPSGTYVHNLTTILRGFENGGFAGAVRCSIPAQSATVHDLALRTADGAGYLVVWNELAIGSANVTVSLGQTYGSVEIYDPTKGATPTQTLQHARSVELTLDGYSVAVIRTR